MKLAATLTYTKLQETNFCEFNDGGEKTLREQLHVNCILDFTQLRNYVQANLYGTFAPIQSSATPTHHTMYKDNDAMTSEELQE